MARTILVTGATGTVGGQVLLKLAGREGVDVRAAVRDPRSVAMAAANVTPVKFSYEDAATMQSACAGVDAVFWVAPVTQNMVELASAFLAAASAAGVPHIVKLSVTGVDDPTPMLVAQWHRDMEAALRATGIPWTSLRPGGFMQNFLGNAAPRPDGNMYAPLGESKTSYIDVRDIANVAVHCLTEPGHIGKAYEMTGPEALTMTQVAAIIGEVSGRQIQFVDIPEEAARQAMLGAKMPSWMVEMILNIQAYSRNGHAEAVTSTVKDVTGNAPITFRQFAWDNAKAWQTR